MTNSALEGGFASPAMQSAQAFRAVMTAMAMPGTIHVVSGSAPPAPLSPASGAVLLTLADADTPIFLAGDADTPEVRAWITFHTGAPLGDAASCTFALGRWEALVPLSAYPAGTPDYPDRSATLIVETDLLTANGAMLSGPGIRDKQSLSLPETQPFSENAALFPLGLDFVFTCGDCLAAVPRTTRVL